MTPGPEGDALHLDHIVELVELIGNDLKGTAEADFLADRTKGDATALRLASIGEASRKLSEELRARHSTIEWRKMYALRNIVAHHYQSLNYRLLWKIAAFALEPLEAACRAELKRIDE
jgi:uncharacterized protein with HEPN domain